MEKQDKARMDGCFEKIPVQVGEVWYIPGGMPHAIGEGITMLEMMEPSDLVVRCEFCLLYTSVRNLSQSPCLSRRTIKN